MTNNTVDPKALIGLLEKADFTQAASDSAIKKSIRTLSEVQEYKRDGQKWLSPGEGVEAIILDEMYVYSPLYNTPIHPVDPDKMTAVIHYRRLDVKTKPFDCENAVSVERLEALEPKQ